MDIAYDHIQEENFKEDESSKEKAADTQSNLNQEFQDAYKAISSSQWGTKLGSLWSSAKKQAQPFLEEAKREYNSASTEASRNLSLLATRARSLSLNENTGASHTIASSDGQSFTDELPRASTDTSATATPGPSEHAEKPESLPADIVKEAEGMLERFKGEAAKRLKDIQKAEDAADEALLKFGTNIRNFLRDAVTVTAPPEDAGKDGSKVLFESKDAEGKRVIHSTRFDAQLHVIHSSLDSFLRDPASELYEPWAKEFDIEKKTDEIAKDLEKYEELRRAMEKCVPERVEYTTFWKRYYFLRHVIETEEARRRELLKGAATTEEEVAWDEESDSEGSSTPQNNPASNSTTTLTKNNAAAPSSSAGATDDKAQTDSSLKPAEPRRSHDQQSQAGSDASYDIVSGASSRTPGSPTDSAGKGKVKRVAEESDEEDWE